MQRNMKILILQWERVGEERQAASIWHSRLCAVAQAGLSCYKCDLFIFFNQYLKMNITQYTEAASRPGNAQSRSTTSLRGSRGTKGVLQFLDFHGTLKCCWIFLGEK